MGLAKELTDSQKSDILAAKKFGHNDVAIAKAIGCHRTTVLWFFAPYESKKSPQNDQVGRAFLIRGIDRNRKITTTKSERNY